MKKYIANTRKHYSYSSNFFLEQFLEQHSINENQGFFAPYFSNSSKSLSNSKTFEKGYSFNLVGQNELHFSYSGEFRAIFLELLEQASIPSMKTLGFAYSRNLL